MSEEGLVEQDWDGRRVTEGRDAADRPPERVGDSVRVGHRHLVRADPEVVGEAGLAHPIRSAGDDDDELPVRSEREAAGYLCDVTADGVGGVGGGLRPLGELLDREVDAVSLSRLCRELRRAWVHSLGMVEGGQNSCRLDGLTPWVAV